MAIRRWLNGGTLSLLLTLLLSVFVLFVYDLVAKQNLTADFTRVTRFTLNEPSLVAIERLRESGRRVQIVGFYPRQYLREREAADIILRQFDAKGGDVIEVTLIDPDESPLLARTYGYDSLQNKLAPIFVAFLKEDGSPDQASIRYVGEANERDISTNLLQMITVSGTKFYFTTGHTELEFTSLADSGLSRASNALDYLGIQYTTINLLAVDRVPDDASALVIVSPNTEYATPEVERIREYVARGGRLLVLANPPYIDSPFGGVNNTILQDSLLGQYFWEEFGVRFQDDLVVDNDSSLDNSRFFPIPVINTAQEMFVGTTAPNVVLFFARSIDVVQEAENDRQAQYYREVLMVSSRDSYGEIKLQEVQSGSITQFDSAEDSAGPVAMGIAVRGVNEINRQDGTRAIFIGDADWLTNAYITSFVGNAQLWAAVIEWLTGTSEAALPDAISDLSRLPITATAQERQRISVLTTLIIPGLVLGVGLVIWFTRRRQR